MGKLQHTLSKNALNQIYLYHLLPIIEYAPLVRRWLHTTRLQHFTKDTE